MSEDKFKPQEHLEDIKGKPYLPVKWRVYWVRQEHPNWQIRTKMVDFSEDWALFQAVVMDENDKVIAMGHKQENKQGFFDYMEKAETGAIGRALAVAGYGTQFSVDLDEGGDVVDAPVEKKGSYDPTPKRLGSERYNCSDCGVGITKKVLDFSMQKYGKPLCIKCQGLDR